MDLLGALAPPVLTSAFGGDPLPSASLPHPQVVPPAGSPPKPKPSILPSVLAIAAITGASAGVGALLGRRDPDIGAGKGARLGALSYVGGAVVTAVVATPIVLWKTRRDVQRS